MRKPYLGLVVLGCVGFALILGQGSHVLAQKPSDDIAILRAVVRDIALPWRDQSKSEPRQTIAVYTESLRQCPPPPGGRGCVTADILALARKESGSVTWPSELVKEFENLTRESVTFSQIDVSGFEPVVVGTRAQLDLSNPRALPLAMSRAAVRDKTALVVVQFARIWTYVVLLNDKGAGWAVTKKFANGAS